MSFKSKQVERENMLKSCQQQLWCAALLKMKKSYMFHSFTVCYILGPLKADLVKYGKYGTSTKLNGFFQLANASFTSPFSSKVPVRGQVQISMSHKLSKNCSQRKTSWKSTSLTPTGHSLLKYTAIKVHLYRWETKVIVPWQLFWTGWVLSRVLWYSMRLIKGMTRQL